LNAASAATNRHIEAVGRLQIANIMQHRDLIPALEQAVLLTRDRREETMAEYKRHEASHRAKSATSSSSD